MSPEEREAAFRKGFMELQAKTGYTIAFIESPSKTFKTETGEIEFRSGGRLEIAPITGWVPQESPTSNIPKEAK